MELETYGKVKTCQGGQSFVPFRYQGQYEDKETGLYYNRFRYYIPEEGMYISRDPIGLASGVNNLFAYTHDSNAWVDALGLYSDLLPSGMGHHLMPRSVAKALGISELSLDNAIAWYPKDATNTADLHKNLHRKLIDEGVLK